MLKFVNIRFVEKVVKFVKVVPRFSKYVFVNKISSGTLATLNTNYYKSNK